MATVDNSLEGLDEIWVNGAIEREVEHFETVASEDLRSRSTHRYGCSSGSGSTPRSSAPSGTASSFSWACSGSSAVELDGR